MARSKNFQVRVSSDTSQFDAGMRKAQQSLRSFQQIASTAFGLGGLATFTAAIGGAVRNIMEFEKANSELAAVLGTNIKGVEGLSNAAKDLGRQSKYTASEVTGLQVALARLGFDTDQIQAMEGSILKFATAMGTDLAAAADFTGSALRAFGLQAEDTKRLLDVMSAATTKSALDFSKLQTSISVVAPIANAFGLSVEETAAFLGVLANNGFDASSAATALRNILLNLSDANGKLAQGIGHSARTFDEIIAAFQELSDKGISVDQVLGMTDKRSAAAAVTIIKQAAAIDKLKLSLTGLDGGYERLGISVENATKIADEFGLSIKDTVALLGALSDIGFDDDSSLAGVRAILEGITDDNGELAKSIGHSVKSFDDLIKAFKEVSAQGLDVARVLGITDKESANAARSLVKGADAADNFRRSLNGADGSLDEMSDTMKNNLAGSVDNLKSAWEGFTLSLSESAGVLKTVVDAVTNAVNYLTDRLQNGISLVEALMGPLAGGALANAWKNNEEALKAFIGPGGTALMNLIGPKQQPEQPEQPAPEPYIGPRQSAVQLLRQQQENPTQTTTLPKTPNKPTTPLTPEQIKARQREAEKAWDEFLSKTLAGVKAIGDNTESVSAIWDTIAAKAPSPDKAAEAWVKFQATVKDAGQEISAEMAEVAEADAEIEAQWDELYDTWRRMADLPPVQPFDNETLLLFEKNLHAINEEMEFQAYLDTLLQENIEKLTGTTVDFSRELENLAVSGLNAAGEALGGLLGDLATGGDAWSNFSNAAISAFGDMAIAVGRIAVAAGAATLGIKAALESMNGYAAIAAGVALIALGAAVKTGLSNVASGNYSATGSVASGSYSATGNDYETRDIQVNVTGTLQADGDKLVAVLNNTNNRNGYTT